MSCDVATSTYPQMITLVMTTYDTQRTVPLHELYKCTSQFHYYCSTRLNIKNNSWHDIAVNAGAITAVVDLSFIVVGATTSLILLYLFCFVVPPSNRLRLWGMLMSFVDIVYLMVVGVYYYSYVHGLPWFGVYRMKNWITDHTSCKFVSLFKDALVTARADLVLIMIFHLREQKSLKNETVHGKLFYCHPIFGIMLLSTLQSLPAWIVSGMWISDGHVTCKPDPQWHEEYHDFYKAHSFLFTNGFIQMTFILILLVPFWTKWRRNMAVLTFLRSRRYFDTAVDKILHNIEMQMETFHSNQTIVLSEVTSFCIARFFYLVSDIFNKDALFVSLLSEGNFKNTIRQMSHGLLHLPIIMEHVSINLEFVIWYHYCPDIRAFFARLMGTKLEVEEVYKVGSKQAEYSMDPQTLNLMLKHLTWIKRVLMRKHRVRSKHLRDADADALRALVEKLNPETKPPQEQPQPEKTKAQAS
ncbi:unnamed protein product [Calicophoron daubneyi]|uniref:G-protein coupled receptors family 1 profile domain-containing protein n=1 Tax=Calicophoron daubneyi TaxID=300641 RepID=A0AAV2T8Q0_CALDB